MVEHTFDIKTLVNAHAYTHIRTYIHTYIQHTHIALTGKSIFGSHALSIIDLEKDKATNNMLKFVMYIRTYVRMQI
jgi:hypothetical protein